MTDIEKLFAATRYRVKEDPSVPKTCQTCIHWDADIERKMEYLSTSMEKCKEIHKSIDIPNNVQWRTHEWIYTRATFGCNGYEKATD